MKAQLFYPIKSQTFVTFIKVLVILLTVLSAYFLIQSTLHLSSKDILQSLKSSWFSLEKGGKIMAQQKADAQLGFSLLILSIFLQMISLLIPKTYDNIDINKIGLRIAFEVFIIIVILSFQLNGYLADNTLREIKKIYSAQQKNN